MDRRRRAGPDPAGSPSSPAPTPASDTRPPPCWPARGAHVVLAVRNLDKGKAAVDRITAATPHADVTLQQLDLTSLDSVREAADDLRADLLPHRPADQQRRRDDTPQGHHHGRLRAAVRHQPPRPLRAHRAAARQHAARRGVAGGDDQQQRAPLRLDPLRRPAVRSAATTGCAPTASPSWPTCCSPTSSTGGCRTRARRPSRVAAHPGGSNTELTRNLPG